MVGESTLDEGERDFFNMGCELKRLVSRVFIFWKKEFWYWKFDNFFPKTAKLDEFILEKQNIPKNP